MEIIIAITNCGWESNTTKERLNGVIQAVGLNYGLVQKNWIWYLDGKQWDGSLTKIK